MESGKVRAVSHLSARLTAIYMTVNEVSSHLCKIFALIIAKTYLQIGETEPHHSTHSCKGHFSLLRQADLEEGFQKMHTFYPLPFVVSEQQVIK